MRVDNTHYQPCDSTSSRSDSEHTQSSHNHNDESFRMTNFINKGVKLAQTAALTLALSFFIAAPAMANNTPPVPAAKTDNSVYQLVETPSAGENTITKYEYNEADKTLTPTHYELQLNNLNLVSDSGNIYLNWGDAENDDGISLPVLSPSDKPIGDYITINVDEKNSYMSQDRPVDNSHAPVDGFFLYNNQAVFNCNGNYVESVAGYYINNNSAIMNMGGYISSIDGVFINNYADDGGAIYNTTRTAPYSEDINYQIDDIKGTFIANTAGVGGAIANDYGNIGNINADFIQNIAFETRDEAIGGAIANNQGYINSINGNFYKNSAISGSYNAIGGAILNSDAYINTITGSFNGNSAVVNGDGNASGGAVANFNLGSRPASIDTYDQPAPFEPSPDNIGSINADFVENKAVVTTDDDYGHAQGGAIFNAYSSIGSINGNFYKNSAQVKYTEPEGQSVSTYATPDFTQQNFYAYGGAISNTDTGVIGKISGNFVENSAVAENAAYSSALGGAVFNSSYNYYFQTQVENVSVINEFDMDHSPANALNIQDANFINNYATATAELRNEKYLDPVYAYGGAVASIAQNEINVSNFLSLNDIKDILLDAGQDIKGLSDNELVDLYIKTGNETGNGLYYTTDSNITNPKISNSYFEGNKAEANGDEYSLALGGAVYSSLRERKIAAGSLDERSANIQYYDNGDSAMVITNSSFVNNTASSPDGTAKGGAIYSEGNLTINADNGVSLFKGNKTVDKNGEVSNAIYMAGHIYSAENEALNSTLPDDSSYYYEITPAKLTLNAVNNGVIQIDDKIAGGAMNENYHYGASEASLDTREAMSPEQELLYNSPFIETEETAYSLKVTGDKTGKVILNNDVINANISLDNTNLYLGRENVFDQSQSLTLNSGSMYMNNDSVGLMSIPSFTLAGDTNLSVDVDLASKTMDRITAEKYNITPDAHLNVNYLNLLSDAKEDKTLVPFAETELKGNVAYTGASPIAYSPIYKYDVSYLDNTGEFLFVRGGGAAPSSPNAYNPAVLTTPVTTQAGAYTTQLQTFNYAFQHADNFMMFPSIERTAFKSENKYAMTPNAGVFSPLMTPSYQNNIWVKPYASFESIPLKNGPKVSNINYGTLVGFDSKLETLSNGFERILTGYIGYNGSSQRYQGVDAYQNGGLLGGTATFYKGNFFNATTLSVGASAGDANTMYGSENYTMLLAGIGNKTGYNFEFKDGKFIFQPAMLLSYSFINTFDYTNAAGVRIDSDPLHAILLSPGLKFIMNTESGWQPYLAVDMTWNILDETRVMANSVRLPDMSIKPYVSYGAGIQKRFKDDKYTAFGQTMVHNGGRRGVSLTFGLRWKVGK